MQKQIFYEDTIFLVFLGVFSGSNDFDGKNTNVKNISLILNTVFVRIGHFWPTTFFCNSISC